MAAARGLLLVAQHELLHARIKGSVRCLECAGAARIDRVLASAADMAGTACNREIELSGVTQCVGQDK
jgi:hypothetical protein